MIAVRLVGRFLYSDGKPAEGRLSVLPHRLWIHGVGQVWATRGADTKLEEGSFNVTVSSGHHTVVTPFGTWEIDVPKTSGPVLLKDLISEANVQ